MELLARHFDIAIETPDGIKKLRELILSLAMRGKLVPQDPNDQPASELLKEIEAEKAKLVKAGKIKKQEMQPPINADERPYELPKRWEWVRLGEILNVKSSKRIFESDYCKIGIPFYRSREIGELSRNGICENRLFISTKKYIEIQNEFGVPKIGDILLTSVGSIGGSWIVDNRQFYYKDGNVTLIETCEQIYNIYVQDFIKSELFVSQVEKAVSGTAYNALTIIKIKELLFPLPPINEQKRIVAKIESLMALCDKLEAERDERNNKRLAIHKAAMNGLLSGKDSHAFDTSWSFVIRHFDTLHSVPQNVDELKKAILQLAVMGKLVPQDLNDQPASELLKEIAAEKAKLVKEGNPSTSLRARLKKQEPLPPIGDEENLYELPNGWEWVRLGEIANISMGQSPDGSSYNTTRKGVPLVNGPVEFGGKSPFAETVAIKFTTAPTKICKKGDLLLCVRGSTTGRTNIAGCDSCIGRGVASLRAYIFQTYLNYFILSRRQNLFDAGIGSTFPNISYSKIACFILGLPPLNEQKRIVEKVDRLIALCDTLQQHLEDSVSKRIETLNAVLAEWPCR